MASTYSDRLKLELMETGANANVWGNNTNTNLQTIDAFGAGYLAKDVAGSANVTLTTANADPTAEASKKVIEFTGTHCRAHAALCARHVGIPRARGLGARSAGLRPRARP